MPYVHPNSLVVSNQELRNPNNVIIIRAGGSGPYDLVIIYDLFVTGDSAQIVAAVPAGVETAINDLRSQVRIAVEVCAATFELAANPNPTVTIVRPFPQYHTPASTPSTPGTSPAKRPRPQE